MPVLPGDKGLGLPQGDGAYVFLPASRPHAGDTVIGYPLKSGGYYAVPMLPVVPGAVVTAVPYNGGYITTPGVLPFPEFKITATLTANILSINNVPATSIHITGTSSNLLQTVNFTFVCGSYSFQVVQQINGKSTVIEFNAEFSSPQMPAGGYDVAINCKDIWNQDASINIPDAFQVYNSTPPTTPLFTFGGSHWAQTTYVIVQDAWGNFIESYPVIRTNFTMTWTHAPLQTLSLDLYQKGSTGSAKYSFPMSLSADRIAGGGTFAFTLTQRPETTAIIENNIAYTVKVAGVDIWGRKYTLEGIYGWDLPAW